MDTKDTIGSICGVLTIIFGVFLLHAFKNVKFNFKDLNLFPSQKRKERVQDGAEAMLMRNAEAGDDEDDDDEETHFTANHVNHT